MESSVNLYQLDTIDLITPGLPKVQRVNLKRFASTLVPNTHLILAWLYPVAWYVYTEAQTVNHFITYTITLWTTPT